MQANVFKSGAKSIFSEFLGICIKKFTSRVTGRGQESLTLKLNDLYKPLYNLRELLQIILPICVT